jgi:TnpA family transposase
VHFGVNSRNGKIVRVGGDVRLEHTFSELDLSVIRQRRGSRNRLGFAVQLCYLRYPGFALPIDAQPPLALLTIVGR